MKAAFRVKEIKANFREFIMWKRTKGKVFSGQILRREERKTFFRKQNVREVRGRKSELGRFARSFCVFRAVGVSNGGVKKTKRRT
jgi:hypothetical protein